LQDLYKEGELFERYNSERRANVTLLAVSVFGIAGLGCLEIIRSRRRLEQRGYVPMTVNEEPVTDGLDTSIYSAPATMDRWEGRRSRSSKSRHHQHMDLTIFYMRVLRIYCLVFTVMYSYTLLNYLFLWLPTGAGHLFLSLLFPTLFVASVMTLAGILRKKTWGMSFGYAMAIFHLLVFPVGTVAGLVMLVALVGSAPEFAIPARERRREAIRKARQKQKKKQLETVPV
jgi:hypothetical protein